MLYFPRTDDTKDLKYLLNKGIFMYDRKDKDMRYGCTFIKGREEPYRSYDYGCLHTHFAFDNEKIYDADMNQVSLAEILIHRLILKEELDDSIREILQKRNLGVSDIFTIGESTTKTDKCRVDFKNDHAAYEAYEIIQN